MTNANELTAVLNLDDSKARAKIKSLIEELKKVSDKFDKVGSASSFNSINKDLQSTQNAIQKVNADISNFSKSISSASTSTDALFASMNKVKSSTENVKIATKSVNDELDRGAKVMSVWASMMLVGYGKDSLNGMVSLVGAANDLHNALISINRVGKFDSAITDNLKKDIKDLSVELPYTFAELGKIVETGVRGQIPQEGMKEYVKLIATVASAFELTAEEASTYLSKIKNSFNLSMEGLKDYADYVNSVTDKSQGFYERDLLNFSQRVAALGTELGLSAKQMAAWGAVFLSSGYAPDKAATAMNKFIQILGTAEVATPKAGRAFAAMGVDVKKLSQLMGTDAVQGMRYFTEEFKKLDRVAKLDVTKAIFGTGIGFTGALKLGSSIDQIGEKLDLASDKARTAGSAQKTLEIQLQSTTDQYKLMTGAIAVFGATIGDGLSPILNQLMQSISGIFKSLTEFVELNPRLSELATIFVAVGVGSLTLIASLPILTLLVGGLATAFGVLLSPIGLVVMAIISAIAIYVSFREEGETVMQRLGALGQSFENLSKSIMRANPHLSSALNLLKSISNINFSKIAIGMEDIASKGLPRLKDGGFQGLIKRVDEIHALRSKIDTLNKFKYQKTTNVDSIANRKSSELINVKAQGFKSIDPDDLNPKKRGGGRRGDSPASLERARQNDVLKDMNDAFQAAQENFKMSNKLASEKQKWEAFWIEYNSKEGLSSVGDAFKAKGQLLKDEFERSRKEIEDEIRFSKEQIDVLSKDLLKYKGKNTVADINESKKIKGDILSRQRAITKLEIQLDINKVNFEGEAAKLITQEKDYTVKLRTELFVDKIENVSNLENLRKGNLDLNLNATNSSAFINAFTQQKDDLLKDSIKERIALYEQEIIQLERIRAEKEIQIRMANDGKSQNEIDIIIATNEELKNLDKGLYNNKSSVIGLKSELNGLDETKAIFKDMGASLRTSLTDGIYELITATDGVGNAFKKLATSLLQSMAKVVSDQISKQFASLLDKAFNAIIGSDFNPTGFGTSSLGLSDISFGTAYADGGMPMSGLNIAHGKEYVFDPASSKLIGLDKLNYLNGYTGNGGRLEPMGLVEDGSFVVNAKSTKAIGIETLNWIRDGGKINPFSGGIRGYANGGYVSPDTSDNIKNSNNMIIPKVEVIINSKNGNNFKVSEDNSKLFSAHIKRVIIEDLNNGGDIFKELNGR